MRKHANAKDGAGDAAGGVEVENLEDGADGMTPHIRYHNHAHYWLTFVIFLDKLTAKAQKITIKLPWEITTIYSEVLRQAGHQSDDEEDEDDIEAHEASIQRLRVCYTVPYRPFSLIHI